MNEETVRRAPGKPVFEATEQTRSLVPPHGNRAASSASKPELSPGVKEMLREMRRRCETDKGSDDPEAA